MTAIRATSDGHSVIVPTELIGHGSGSKSVIFDASEAADRMSWSAAQESALAKVWDNADDAIYDDL
jgi:hypothetical protein